MTKEDLVNFQNKTPYVDSVAVIPVVEAQKSNKNKQKLCPAKRSAPETLLVGSQTPEMLGATASHRKYAFISWHCCSGFWEHPLADELL